MSNRLFPAALSAVLAAGILASTPPAATAGDWPGFRGPNADNISTEKGIPLEWSDSKNLAWTAELPGPGSSSPIVHGDRVFVTCYSGYGLSRDAGRVDDLKRHLVCLDAKTGEIIFDKTVDSAAREDSYSGFITEHGYASSTPVTDGENVYCFFGKSGVVAFTRDGKKLWQVSVGTESSNRRWGSAASLVLYKDSVIVNASEESQSIIALKKSTGEEIWKTEASLLELAYTTPGLVDPGNGAKELVIPVPDEVWALNPDNGKLKWYCETSLRGNISPSINTKDGIIYACGGFRGVGSLAIRAGGKDDVTSSHVVWTSRATSYVATPVLHDGTQYWVDDKGVAWATSAKTGEEIYRERLETGGGRPFYASPVLCEGRLYVPSRRDGVYVIEANPGFKLLAQNRLSDDTDFNASVAIANGQLLLRSNKAIYCIRAK